MMISVNDTFQTNPFCKVSAFVQSMIPSFVDCNDYEANQVVAI